MSAAVCCVNVCRISYRLSHDTVEIVDNEL